MNLKIGSDAKIIFKTNDIEIEYSGDVVEEARTKAVTKDEVADHICRTGQTPFRIDKIEINLEDNVGIGFSTLHHLRTDALNLLEKELLKTDRPILEKRKPNKNIKNNISKAKPSIVKSDDLFSSKEFCDKLGKVYQNISSGEAFEVGPHLPVANVEAVYYFKNLGAKRI